MFVINRDLQSPMEVELTFHGFAVEKIIEHKVLNHEELSAANTEEEPEKVMPKDVKTTLDTITLEPHSYNMIRVKVISDKEMKSK